jgi:hypothetical protein
VNYCIPDKINANALKATGIETKTMAFALDTTCIGAFAMAVVPLTNVYGMKQVAMMGYGLAWWVFGFGFRQLNLRLPC